MIEVVIVSEVVTEVDVTVVAMKTAAARRAAIAITAANDD